VHTWLLALVHVTPPAQFATGLQLGQVLAPALDDR
jgi:hypothetical protein